MAGGGGMSGSYGVNPMTNAAQGMSNSFNLLNEAYSAGNTGARTYDPSTYNPAMQQAAPTIASRMGAYTNPYENQVVQRTTDNMMRTGQEMQIANGDAAAAAGAFGGGRHGLVESLTNAEVNRNIGDMTAGLRQSGFNTAAGLAGQDVANTLGVRSANQAARNAAGQFNANSANTAGQFNANMRAGNDSALFDRLMGLSSAAGNAAQASYGLGRDINSNQMQSGGMSQQLLQTLLSGGSDLYSQYMSQPERLLQMRLGAVGMSPLNNATTTTATQSSPNTLLPNLLSAAGNMFSFSPINLFGGGS